MRYARPLLFWRGGAAEEKLVVVVVNKSDVFSKRDFKGIFHSLRFAVCLNESREVAHGVHDQRTQLGHDLVVVVGEHKMFEVHFLGLQDFGGAYDVCLSINWRFGNRRFGYGGLRHRRGFAAGGWSDRPLLAESGLLEVARWRLFFGLFERDGLDRFENDPALVRD